MINFVVFDDNKSKRELYVKIIKKFFYMSCVHYNIYEFDSSSSSDINSISSLSGFKIYLIDLDFDSMNGYRIAKKIRTDGDLKSPIILLIDTNKKVCIDNLNNILYVGLVQKDDSLVKNLIGMIRDSYRIIENRSSYCFSLHDEVYKLPYDDILYIIKNTHEDTVTIVTKDDEFLNYETIRELELYLRKDARFLKVHRSCIVNLHKISIYDRKENIIIFNNGAQINLVSRQYKNILSSKLEDYGNAI